MDRGRRLLFSQVEVKLLLYRYILLKKKLLESIVYDGFLESIEYNTDFYKTKVTGVCIMTGRIGNINRYYRLSRIYLRKLGGFNYLYGLRKSSW